MQNSTHARVQLDATESRVILSYVILTFRNSECRNDITKLRAKAIDLQRVGSKISLSATQAPLILWEVGLLITENLWYEKLVSKVNQRQPIQNAKYLRNHVEADRDLRSGATWLFFLKIQPCLISLRWSRKTKEEDTKRVSNEQKLKCTRAFKMHTKILKSCDLLRSCFRQSRNYL